MSKVNNYTIMKKLLVWLKIILERKENQELNRVYTYRKLNLYNPLSYLWLAIAIPISIWQGGCDEMRESLKNTFKWK